MPYTKNFQKIIDYYNNGQDTKDTNKKDRLRRLYTWMSTPLYFLYDHSKLDPNIVDIFFKALTNAKDIPTNFIEQLKNPTK